MEDMLSIKMDFFFRLIREFLIRDTWQTLQSCDVLLIRHDNDCGYIFQEKAYAQFIDSFGELCTKKTLKVQSIAIPLSVLNGTKTYFSAKSFNQRYIIINLIYFFLRLIYQEDISIQWKKNRLDSFWCEILKKALPKVIVGIQPDPFICHAGKKMNIPVFDLQHGVIADDHQWYGFDHRISTPVRDLPDGFLCWDEQSVKVISKWAHKKGVIVKKIGNPWFHRFIIVDQEDLLVQKELRNEDIGDTSKPSILVTLRWGKTHNNASQAVSGVTIDVLETVIHETIDKYNWIIRLHPVQLRSQYLKKIIDYMEDKYGLDNAQRWLISSFKPLPIILKQTDIHLTEYSSVIIEASWMGIPSGLLSDEFNQGGSYENIYTHERSLGIASVLPHDPEIIKQWIEDTLTKGRAKPTMDTTGEELDAFVNEIVERCKNRNK